MNVKEVVELILVVMDAARDGVFTTEEILRIVDEAEDIATVKDLIEVFQRSPAKLRAKADALAIDMEQARTDGDQRKYNRLRKRISTLRNKADDREEEEARGA